MFEGSYINKLHWRVHCFLESCTHSDVSEIDTAKHDFTDILEQIEQCEYATKTPEWIRSLVQEIKYRLNHKKHGGGGVGRGRGRRRRQTRGQCRF